MEQGLELLVTVQSVSYRSQWLALLAEVYSKLGRSAEALATVDNALAFVAKSGERFYAAEVWRLKGELLPRNQKSKGKSQRAKVEAEAEACFQRAIGIAQEQDAKWWELRASVSLACVWQAQGKQAEAAALLGPVCDWFTDGFDAEDLREARALLRKLNA